MRLKGREKEVLEKISLMENIESDETLKKVGLSIRD